MVEGAPDGGVQIPYPVRNLRQIPYPAEIFDQIPYPADIFYLIPYPVAWALNPCVFASEKF